MAFVRGYTNEEMLRILDASLAANDRGDYAEEKRLLRSLPIEPITAKVAKRMYGKQYLLDEGYDLSHANEEYGEGWLDKDD